MSNPQDEILSAVVTIVSDLFGVAPDELGSDSTRESVDGWDSLQQVNLVMDVESRFQVHLSETQIARIQGIGSLVEIVAEELSKSIDT